MFLNATLSKESMVPRPHRAILSRELIFGTALDLLDRTGRFTVPELAAKLGVSVSSLYHHVQGRAEIVEGIRGLLASTMIDPQGDPDDWQQAVTGWARRYRDSFAAHPAAIPALVAQTVSDPVTLAQYDAVAGVLERAGHTDDTIVLAITMLDTLCLGAALDLGAPSVIWEVNGRDSALSRALAGATSDVDRSTQAFEIQLGLIVQELANRLAVEPA